MHLNFEYFPILFVFGLGVITGIVSIVRLIRTALEKFRSVTVYLIIGLMLGSIYSVVVGPMTLDAPKDALSFANFDWIFFIIGGIIIIGMQVMGMKKENTVISEAEKQ